MSAMSALLMDRTIDHGSDRRHDARDRVIKSAQMSFLDIPQMTGPSGCLKGSVRPSEVFCNSDSTRRPPLALPIGR
jgi:hypothetical protein